MLQCTMEGSGDNEVREQGESCSTIIAGPVIRACRLDPHFWIELHFIIHADSRVGCKCTLTVYVPRGREKPGIDEH